MSPALLAFQAIIIIALAWVLHQQNKTSAQTIALLLQRFDAERIAARDERTELMNRITHPQVFQPRPSDVRPQLHPVDDEPSDLQELARIGGIVMGEPPE